ncbi:MAG: molybdenum cofactor guanylyltransferase [Algoriphagus sp.]|nr:molybdenum cofactor guanylyltransferase [Algoriphagus sp.]
MLNFPGTEILKNDQPAAYILCGGKSTRMQEEKGLVLFQGKTFLRWILDAIAPLTIKPILVTKNSAYQSYGLEMIRDVFEDKGPVGGIHAALLHSSQNQILLLSCDIPKITTEVLVYLIQKSQEFPDKISFLSDGINDYPLIGIYPKTALETFSKSVEAGHLKLCPLVYSLPHQRVVLDPARKISLQNINSKEQLQSLS